MTELSDAEVLLAVMKEFCSENHPQPWRLPGTTRVIAYRGTALIECFVGDLPRSIVSDGDKPDPDSIFRQHDWKLGFRELAVSYGVCEREMHYHKCSECNATGRCCCPNCDAEHECGCCRGQKWSWTYERCNCLVDFEGVVIFQMDLLVISHLPGIEFKMCGDYLLFSFRRGRGVVSLPTPDAIEKIRSAGAPPE